MSEIIETRDNEVGFDPTLVNKLFPLFSRPHDDGQLSDQGIGLARVQSIVKRHLGRVWAESEFGQGSCFCFTLGTALVR